MKVKPVYVATSAELQSSAPPAPQQETAQKPPNDRNIERDILKDWQRLIIRLSTGEEILCELVEFGIYWLHVQNNDGPRLINKGYIVDVQPAFVSNGGWS